MKLMVVGMPTSHMAIPSVPSDLRLCEICGTEVWLSHATKEDADNTGEEWGVGCMLCFLLNIATGEAELEPPGPETLSAIDKAMGGQVH